MLFVAKKDGTLRMCVNYRGLNNVTVHSKYPLPRIAEMLDRLQGAKVFSSLDLASGFHQLGLREADVPKTAFCMPDGLYEFLVMPFGLTNAPAVFQNAMDGIFRQCRAFVCVYMEDLLIFSKSHEQHLQHLRIVLHLLRRHRLFVKPSKCTWLRHELSFLGHLVGQDGIKVDPAKIQMVRDWPRPENLLRLRQFLGLTNYFRRFVQGYAARVTPLVRLTKKDMPFVWSSKRLLSSSKSTSLVHLCWPCLISVRHGSWSVMVAGLQLVLCFYRKAGQWHTMRDLCPVLKGTIMLLTRNSWAV